MHWRWGIAAVFGAVLLFATPAAAQFPGANVKIAFARSGDIYTMNPDGTGATRLTSSPSDDSEPDWSPSGNKIAFSGTDSSCACWQIFVMNADGSGRTMLTSLPTTASPQ